MNRKLMSIAMIGGLFAIAAAPVAASGEAVFNKTCKMCHLPGLAGAPKLGDKADWAARGEKGIDALVQRAIKGFKGTRGMMPPKGGNPSLSDADVRAAVQYMLDSAK